MLASFGKLNVDQLAARLKEIKSASWDLLLSSKIIDPEAIDDLTNLNMVRRYLPNAYIRSKATLLGALALSKNVNEFEAWRAAVLADLSDDESNKIHPYLREVFETAHKLVRETDLSLREEPVSRVSNHITMNRNQRIAIIIGALLLVIMLLIPPWRLGGGRPGGYHLLFWPPDRNISIDFARLIVQCLLVAAVTVGSFLLLRSKQD